MTKHIFVVPARAMRSRRNSLTARGRAPTSSAMRPPTGRSSFEKASGWMRVPLPAAATMPHISDPPCHGFALPVLLQRVRHGGGMASALLDGSRVGRAALRGLHLQAARTRAALTRHKVAHRQLPFPQRLFGGGCLLDFLARLEDCVAPPAAIAQDRHATVCSPEQPG